jgi:hypothetical protein
LVKALHGRLNDQQAWLAYTFRASREITILDPLPAPKSKYYDAFEMR